MTTLLRATLLATFALPYIGSAYGSGIDCRCVIHAVPPGADYSYNALTYHVNDEGKLAYNEYGNLSKINRVTGPHSRFGGEFFESPRPLWAYTGWMLPAERPSRNIEIITPRFDVETAVIAFTVYGDPGEAPLGLSVDGEYTEISARAWDESVLLPEPYDRVGARTAFVDAGTIQGIDGSTVVIEAGGTSEIRIWAFIDMDGDHLWSEHEVFTTPHEGTRVAPVCP